MFSSLPDGYLAVHVKGMVKQEFVTKFYEKTFENAMNSVSEEGIARFDVLRQVDDPTKFLLLEIYKNKDAPALHKEANHYLSWRDFVAPMMAEPRGSVKYTTIFPPTVNWNMECSASSEFFTTSTKSSQENAPYIPEDGMLAVIVDIEVKPGTENEFIAATRENCQNSIMEVRFDLISIE
jgi:quinol monooxygenase YgiN